MTRERELEIRMQCLDLAVKSMVGDPLTTAGKYFRFVTGGDTHNPMTPAEFDAWEEKGEEA